MKTAIIWKLVVLPEKLVSIPENAFRNTKLTELNLPESVTEIGQYAFMGCNNLKQINLTDNITKLGDHVFASCANLSEVKFGAGITQIPSYAFDHCQALNNVILPYWTTEIAHMHLQAVHP